MLSCEIKNINRNGIRFLKADYYNECLYGLKGRVIIKYSLSDLTKIKIYTLNNEFICEAERVMPIHPMANYLGDIKDQEELKFKLRQQKKLVKQTLKELHSYLVSRKAGVLDWQEIPKIEKVEPPKLTFKIESEPNDGRPNFTYRYQRYEWHLQNGFANDKDVAWFNEYKLSDEYKQMYGEEDYESKVCQN